MKLTKENVYIKLQGKSKEELTELYWLLKNNNQNIFHNDLSVFIEEYYKTNRFLEYYNKRWGGGDNSKTEVTIQQLKEILQPMGTFAPIAMKCTQEQFEAIKPKLKGLKLWNIDSFSVLNYLTNNIGEKENVISNVMESSKGAYNRVVYEQWNEEIFLKACGIEVESLEQQLQKAEAEVKRLKEAIEDNKIKDGDWCMFWNHDKSKSIIAKFQGSKFACITSGDYFLNCEKITDSVLLESLNRLF